MLQTLPFPPSGVYRTGSEQEPLQFFLEALPRSQRLDLLLGYFSSSAIGLLALGFAGFIARGGKVRLVINDILSKNDKAALLRAAQPEMLELPISLDDAKSLKERLDGEGQHFFDCLAYLIAQKRIELVPVRPKGGGGISHFKSGVFSDGRDKLYFSGSCNFTAQALLGNLESLEIRKSWDGEQDKLRIEEFEDYFENLFYKKSTYVEYIEVAQIEEAILETFGGKGTEELLEEGARLLKAKKEKFENSPALKKRAAELTAEIEVLAGKPRFPGGGKPRTYQENAYTNWEANGRKGIFAMATGTGKTIASLNCLLQLYKQTGLVQAVILAPTNVLIEQWEKECGKFNFSPVHKVSSKYKWLEGLSPLLTYWAFGGAGKPFVIVASYRTFFGKDFQKNVYAKLPADTLLIADEAHNLASPSCLPLLPTFRLHNRIGLSATPKRVYDQEGTAQLEAFFGDKPPYVMEFGMKEAIDNNFLCRYDYYPIIVDLTESEKKLYAEITKKMGKFHFLGEADGNQALQMLLMQRKRVLHKAENKLPAFRKILHELHEADRLSYMLVYAPEGSPSQNARETGLEEELEDVPSVIDLYSGAVRQEMPEARVTQYTSVSEGKDAALAGFAAGQIDVLLSMKCLDEGVDIPRAEVAVFCASTGNPRQFIQRRGRILRKHPDKGKALIYDLVVAPMPARDDPNYETEKKIFKKELERVANFANLADNYREALRMLAGPLEHYDLVYNLIEDDF